MALGAGYDNQVCTRTAQKPVKLPLPEVSLHLATDLLALRLIRRESTLNGFIPHQERGWEYLLFEQNYTHN
jgi:hypothetical protein